MTRIVAGTATIIESSERLYFDGEDGRQIAHDGGPVVAGIGGGVDLAAGGAEVDAALVHSVDGHGVAQHIHEAVTLRQTPGERLPLIAADAAAEDTQLAVRRVVF